MFPFVNLFGGHFLPFKEDHWLMRGLGLRWCNPIPTIARFEIVLLIQHREHSSLLRVLFCSFAELSAIFIIILQHDFILINLGNFLLILLHPFRAVHICCVGIAVFGRGLNHGLT
jgi:hypothetical protein